MKPTADQVIEEFDALAPDEKQKVYAMIVQREHDIPSVIINDPQGLLKYMEDLLGVPLTVSLKIRWKGILVAFVPNLYVSNYTEIWLLEAVLGSATVRKRLDESHILDADFIEDLFRQAPYSFYLNQEETWLFSDYVDLNEVEGGPLKQLTAFDALQRYGLKLLEEAKEKQYVRL